MPTWLINRVIHRLQCDNWFNLYAAPGFAAQHVKPLRQQRLCNACPEGRAPRCLGRVELEFWRQHRRSTFRAYWGQRKTLASAILKRLGHRRGKQSICRQFTTGGLVAWAGHYYSDLRRRICGDGISRSSQFQSSRLWACVIAAQPTSANGVPMPNSSTT